MKNKLVACAALMLALSLSCAAALGATANASIVAPNSVKVTAPFNGTLKPFDLAQGDAVNAGDVLFAMDAAPVYAPADGKVTAVFAEAGDDASGVMNRYGALAVIEPENMYYIAASTQQAYDKEANRVLHAGETLYLKCGNEKGEGRVTRVDGANYVVEILDGDFELNDTVRCYRDSDHDYDSETGRGRVMRYADTAVAAQGRIAAVYAQAGETVKTGDLLFEVVDAMAAKDAPLTLTAEASGAITYMGTISGAQVYRGQLLCEIADLSTLELSAQVDEIDLASVHVGDVLAFTLDAYAGETFSGTVTQIRPIGTPRQNATYFDVRITLPAGKTLLPGMNGTVTVGE